MRVATERYGMPVDREAVGAALPPPWLKSALAVTLPPLAAIVRFQSSDLTVTFLPDCDEVPFQPL
jgi:hypothetical protein